MGKLEAKLGELAGAGGPVGEAARAALARLRTFDVTNYDLSGLRDLLQGPHARALEAALRGADAGAQLDAIQTHDAWSKVVAEDRRDGTKQIFFGKDANLDAIKRAAAPDGPRTDSVAKHWVFAGSGGTSVSAAEIILANTVKAEVTLAGRDAPDGLLANTQFRGMVERHGDKALFEAARKAGIFVKEGNSDGRLHLLKDGSYDFVTPKVRRGPDGGQQFELLTKGTGEADAVKDKAGNAVVGDMFVASLGSAEQFPPDIAALVAQARRADPANVENPEVELRPVRVKANFTPDDHYVGYTVLIRLEGVTREFQVTGAASRYVPKDELKDMGAEGAKDLQKIANAAKQDSPSRSGGFPGGFAPTAVQGNRHGGARP